MYCDDEANCRHVDDEDRGELSLLSRLNVVHKSSTENPRCKSFWITTKMHTLSTRVVVSHENCYALVSLAGASLSAIASEEVNARQSNRHFLVTLSFRSRLWSLTSSWRTSSTVAVIRG